MDWFWFRFFFKFDLWTIESVRFSPQTYQIYILPKNISKIHANFNFILANRIKFISKVFPGIAKVRCNIHLVGNEFHEIVWHTMQIKSTNFSVVEICILI